MMLLGEVVSVYFFIVCFSHFIFKLEFPSWWWRQLHLCIVMHFFMVYNIVSSTADVYGRKLQKVHGVFFFYLIISKGWAHVSYQYFIIRGAYMSLNCALVNQMWLMCTQCICMCTNFCVVQFIRTLKLIKLYFSSILQQLHGIWFLPSKFEVEIFH